MSFECLQISLGLWINLNRQTLSQDISKSTQVCRTFVSGTTVNDIWCKNSVWRIFQSLSQKEDLSSSCKQMTSHIISITGRDSVYISSKRKSGIFFTTKGFETRGIDTTSKWHAFRRGTRVQVWRRVHWTSCSFWAHLSFEYDGRFGPIIVGNKDWVLRTQTTVVVT